MSTTTNLNQRAADLCRHVIENAEALDVEVINMHSGAIVLDFGTDRNSTTAAGIKLAEICMADLATIETIDSPIDDFNHTFLSVETSDPLNACIAAQYAGWPFSTEYLFSMCSGPARALRGKEDILTRFKLTSDEGTAVGIFETNRLPGEDDIAEFASECGVLAENVILCVAKTCSTPGTVQVVARSVETAMHKLFEIGFDLRKVKQGIGTAPICPLGKDDYQSMGWTNDSILYGGDVQLWIDDAGDVAELAKQLPSSSSAEFGRPFIEIFEFYERDFYKVDRMLFSPARITVNCLTTNTTATAGSLHPDILNESFRK